MKRVIRLSGLLFLGLMLLQGCGGKDVIESGYMEGAPTWVVKGSGAFEDSKGRVFYGVGSAQGISNHSLLRTTAGNRARNEVAKIFQAYTASLMKDYSASTMAGDPNVTSEEQHVEQAIKTVASATLSGVEIIDHWQAGNGELFALASLNLEQFKNALDKAKELNARTRDYIRENSDKLHNELSEEEEKMRNR